MFGNLEDNPICPLPQLVQLDKVIKSVAWEVGSHSPQIFREGFPLSPFYPSSENHMLNYYKTAAVVMVSYLFPSIISWPNAANTFTVPPDTTIWAHIFKTFEDGYGYDCGLWRDAPLESVQWPPPVRFSTNGITSGKVVPLKSPPFGCKYSTGEDHIVCQGCSYYCQIRKCT